MNLEVKHLVVPAVTRAVALADSGETISAFLEREAWTFDLPTICVMNGAPVLRAEWADTVITPEDRVVFLSRPLGGGEGGGKLRSIVGLVALIALTAIAGPAGSFLAGTVLGLTGIAFTIGAAVATGLIAVGGSLLISTLLAPKPGGQQDPSADDNLSADQVYSLSAAGNSARLLGPIPVAYGLIKSFPDYATTPYADYVGGDEYLNVVLSLSAGIIRLDKVFIDDTVLWDSVTGIQAPFTDVTINHFDPGSEITTFPINVLTAAEVSGQELPDPAVTPWLGFFTANTAGTNAYALNIDLAFPAGLFSVSESSGIFGDHNVRVIVQYQEINSVGTPIGAIVTGLDKTYTMNTRTPQRFTEKIDVTPGRYQVRVQRTNKPNQDVVIGSTTLNTSDTVVWMALRAFVNGSSSFASVSTLAIRMKATGQLSQQGAKKFGVLMMRGVDQYDSDINDWVFSTSDNPVWAFYDAAVNTLYGAGRSPAKIDVATIIAEADACETRGDAFNYVFTDATTIPQAFDKILAPARLKHRWAGDVLTLVRDEWKPIPQMLLTDQQIIRGSLSIDYVFNDENNADAVIIEYLDEDIWGPAEAQYPQEAVDFTSVNPTRIRLDGITNRDNAAKAAAFYYKQAYYRRIFITLTTEHDGRLLNLLSSVRIQSELPQTWGQAGEIHAVSGYELELFPAPTWAVSGQHYINIRTRVGGSWGPVKVSIGAEDNIAVVDETDAGLVETQLGISFSQALDRAEDAEFPTYDFGLADNLSRRALVLSGRPSGDRVELSLVIDDEDVHDDDAGTVPPIPSTPPLQPVKIPYIIGLIGNFRQGVAEAVIEASWWPSNAATSYTADVSYDLGVSWTHVYDGAANSFSAVVSAKSLRLRVAGVGAQHGPYATVNLVAPDIVIAPGTVDTISFEEGLRDYVTNEFNRTAELIRKWEQTIASVAVEQEAANWLDKYNVKRNQATDRDNFNGQISTLSTSVTAQFGDAFAAIETNQTAIADLTSSFAAYQVTVDARFGDNEALIETNAIAISDLDGAFSTLDTFVAARIGTATGAPKSATVIDSLGLAVFQSIAHGFAINDPVIVEGNPNTYYIRNDSAADYFVLTATSGGSTGITTSVFPVGPTYSVSDYQPGTIESTVSTNSTTIASHTSSIASMNATVTARMGSVGVGQVFTMAGDTPINFLTTTAHGLVAGDRVILTTTGALYTGLPANTDLFVIAAGLSATQFRLSLTAGGSAINGTGTPSGVHTFYKVGTGTIQASVNTNATAIATIDGKLLATYQVSLNANGYISGLKLYNDGTTAAFIISADVFQIAWPSVTGGTPVPAFQVANVNGVAKLAMRGDMFADGDITARMLTTSSAVITGSAQIGNLVVTALNIADNAVTVPAAASRVDNISGIGFGTFIDDTLTCSMDITGVAGKTLTIFTLCKYGTIYGVTGEQEGALELNGSVVDTAGGGLGATTVLMYTHSVTATGSVQSFAAALNWRGNAANTLTQRSMFMIGAKR